MECYQDHILRNSTKGPGFKQKGAKEWISASTWQKVEERKQLKAKMLNSKSQRLLEKTKMSYKNKDER